MLNSSFSKSALLIIIILIAAFLVRIFGIGFGLPYPHDWDEPQKVDVALRMMKTGDFNPHFFNWPTLYIYLQLMVYVTHYFYSMGNGSITSLDEYKTADDTGWPWTMSHPSLYLFGRLLTCILGTITVYLIYVIGRTLYNEKLGLVAALFLAFSPGHVEHSRFIALDVPGAFFIALTVLYTSFIFKDGTKISYILAGLFAGFSISTKYNNFLVIIPLILAHALNTKKEKVFSKNFFLMLFYLVFGFYLGCPYALWDLSNFLRGAGWEVAHYKVLGHFGSAEGDSNWVFYLSSFYDHLTSGFLFVFCLLGLFFGFFRNYKNHLFLISFPVLYFIYMAIQKTRFLRSMVPVLPFVYILASVGMFIILDNLISRFIKLQKYKNIVPVGLSLILISMPALKSISYAKELHDSKDSRRIAAEWIKKNIEEGAKIAIARELRFYINDLRAKNFKLVECSLYFNKEWCIKNDVNYFITSDKGCFFWWSNDQETKDLLKKINNDFKTMPIFKSFGEGNLFLDVRSVNPRVIIVQVKKTISPLKSR